MSEEALKKLFDSLQLFSGELSFLRQLVHLQHAEIQTLREYTIGLMSELHQTDRSAVFQEVSRRTRETYDKNIERLEATYPAMAASIDMRDRLDRDQADWWYFPSENLPPTPEG